MSFKKVLMVLVLGQIIGVSAFARSKATIIQCSFGSRDLDLPVREGKIEGSASYGWKTNLSIEENRSEGIIMGGDPADDLTQDYESLRLLCMAHLQSVLRTA
jgi:hypothetical protein